MIDTEESLRNVVFYSYSGYTGIMK